MRWIEAFMDENSLLEELENLIVIRTFLDRFGWGGVSGGRFLAIADQRVILING